MKQAILIIFILTMVYPVYAETKAQPCSSANHRAFDFWLGEWRVTNADGKLVGSNSISLVQDGCVVREEWRSATSSYTGTSYNAYNQKTNQWEQLWLDNQGGRLHLKGQKHAKEMILASEKQANKEGINTINRITWTENDDGSVRQLWESIDDEGSVNIVFDGLYSTPNQ